MLKVTQQRQCSEGGGNQPPLASGATCLLRRPPSRRCPRGLTRIVSTRLCTLAGSSTDGSGRMSTLSGTLCTAAMQPEWILPPCAPPPGPGPSRAPRSAPALPSAPPARSPIAPPPAWPPPPSRPLTRPGRTIPAGGRGARARVPFSPGPSVVRSRPGVPKPDSGSARGAPRNPRGGVWLSPGGASPAPLRPSESREWKRPDWLTQGESAGRGAGERG